MTRVVETFRGSLLTRHFVEHVLAREFAGRLGEASAHAMRRHCGRRLREAQARLGPASSVRAICEAGAVPLFRQIGYAVRAVRLRAHAEHGAHTANGEVIVATLEAAHGVALTLVVCPWQERLDRLWRIAVQSGLSVRQRWCVCFNGRQLRVIDVNRPYARRFLEYDLRRAVEDASGFQLLWALLRPQALAKSSQGVTLLDQIVAACDAHGGSVREALQHGVRCALSSLAAAFARCDRGRRDARAGPADIMGQALTIIYRLLFLLFAEARALVPVWHPIYRDSYSVGALQALAGQRKPRGLWPAVQAISRLAHDGCATDDLSVTAFNGQLFSPEHTPLGERLSISSAVIADVLNALMTTPARRGNGSNGRGRERITYADLGVEQLGTVYERVLDYAPQLEREIDAIFQSPARRQGRLAQRPVQRRSSTRRKETGSFYTPRSMADYLVRVTLGPLVAKASADEILSLRVLDPAMGSGAFLVSACRFLAHAVAARDAGGTPADVRRYIARHCLFGVDLNPMAVQLARLSVWLTTMTRDAPLTFLDHHFRVGDSLVGASLDDLLRRPPVRPRSRAGGRRLGARAAGRARGAGSRARWDGSVTDLPLFSGIDHAQVMRAILPARMAMTALDDSPATVREKERLLQSLAREGALSRWLQLADVWCAAWFPDTGAHSGTSEAGVQGLHSGAPVEAAHAASVEAASAASIEAAPAAAWPALVDHLLHGRAVFPQPTLDAWLGAVRRTAARRRFFHWTLEFPEVFFDAEGQPLDNGGFDAIVGNPPWEMIRNDARNDEGGGKAPDKDPQRGPQEDPQEDIAALSRFVRQAGLYPSAGDAHFNCYQLFVERSLALLKRGGRFGLVLPWGIAADHGSARLRRRLLESCDLDMLVSFENNRAVFPIHRSTRFALLSGAVGHPTRAVLCHFGERDPNVLDTFSLEHEGMSEREPMGEHESLNEQDALNEQQPLNEQEHTTGSPSARRRRALVVTPEFLRHVSGDGLAFPDARTAMDITLLERLHAIHPSLASADGWQVKFGRELNESDDRALLQPATRESSMPVVDGKRLRPFTVALESVRYAVGPEQQRQLLARLPDVARARLAFRDIASPTNRLTLIAALLPAGVVSTHTVSCLKSSLDIEAQWCLCALLNSFVANYLVRMRVSTHVTVAMIERMPVPMLFRDSPGFLELAKLAEQLSRATPDATRAAPYARLQALAARAYDLSDPEFRYVLTTFTLIEEETKRDALDAFHE